MLQPGDDFARGITILMIDDLDTSLGSVKASRSVVRNLLLFIAF